MDLLYSRYSSPFEFMRPYIDHGRFGEWVTEIINQENARRQEQAEKEEDEKLWIAYVHSYSGKSFVDWKSDVLKTAKERKGRKNDEDITDGDIDSIYNRLFVENRNATAGKKQA